MLNNWGFSLAQRAEAELLQSSSALRDSPIATALTSPVTCLPPRAALCLASVRNCRSSLGQWPSLQLHDALFVHYLEYLAVNRTTYLLTMIAVLTLPETVGLSQDGGFPYLNTLGRLAGVGYTKGGYHAPANGQMPIVKRHHPASSYGSWRLSYPYNPAYQAFRVSNTRSNILYQPGMPGPAPTIAPKPPEPVEPEVAKPQDGRHPWCGPPLVQRVLLYPDDSRSGCFDYLGWQYHPG